MTDQHFDYREEAAALYAAARIALKGAGYEDPAELAVVGILGILLAHAYDDDEPPHPARAAEQDPLELDDDDTIEQPVYTDDSEAALRAGWQGNDAWRQTGRAHDPLGYDCPTGCLHSSHGGHPILSDAP